MRKIGLFFILFSVIGIIAFAISCSINKPAKYVFYFIGDGMGLAQVTATEIYMSALEDKMGGANLPFSQFPVTGFATTYSANKYITCSSAAGTALATGTKTNNGMIGLAPAGDSLTSIAYKLKKAGYKIGITTSVGVNHATPGAFYGHNQSRNAYYEIGLELPKTGFDFFAGASMLDYKGADKNQQSLYEVIASQGYGVARGLQQYDSVKNISPKMLWVEKPDTLDALAYAIDRKGSELTLPAIVDKAITFLGEKNSKGFFLMAEGGKIDWASHSNDAATVIKETQDFAAAVQLAIAFYNQHPDETLIVVTADHETGGLGMGRSSGYEMEPKLIGSQKVSKDVLSSRFHNMMAERKGKLSWDEVKSVLKANLGFWDSIEINEKDEKKLKDCYDETFAVGKEDKEATLYANIDAITNLAVKIINDKARYGWTTSSHTGIPVPVYAIGAGSGNFAGKMDNTDIPKKIMKSMGVEF